MGRKKYHYLMKEANLGNPGAHHLLANYFAQIPDSSHLVNKHMRAAANYGHTPAQMLVVMDIDLNPREAKVYYKSAVKKRERNALTMLASAEERLGANPAKLMRIYRDAMRKEGLPYAVMLYNAIKEKLLSSDVHQDIRASRGETSATDGTAVIVHQLRKANVGDPMLQSFLEQIHGVRNTVGPVSGLSTSSARHMHDVKAINQKKLGSDLP